MTVKTRYYVRNNGVDQFQIAVPKELRRFFSNKPFIRHNLAGEGGSMLAEIQSHAIKYKELFAKYRQYIAQESKKALKSEDNPDKDDPHAIESDALAILQAYDAFPMAGKTPAKVPGKEYEYPHLDLIEDYLRDRKNAGKMTDADKMAERLLMEPLPFRLSGCLDLYFENHEKGKESAFRKNTQNHWGHVIRVLKDKAVKDITRKDAAHYIKERVKEVKTGTVDRELSTIRAVLGKVIDALELGINNPFARTTIQGKNKDAKVRESYSDAELVIIIKDCLIEPDDKKVILLICCLSSCRLSEAAGLRREDLHLHGEAPYMSFTEWGARSLKTKSSARNVPLVSLAVEVLKKHLASHKSEFAFPTYCSDAGVKGNSISAVLIKRIKKLGIADKGVHNTRHTGRDLMRNAEIIPYLIDAIGGWGADSIGESYGSGYSNKVKYEAMVKAYQPILDMVAKS